MNMATETELKNDQVSSTFEKIRSTEKEEASDASSFSIGSTSSSNHAKEETRPTTTIEKTGLFSSQLPQFSKTAPYHLTVEQEKASAAARCLAILGVTTPNSNQPTQEEIQASRRQREQDIWKEYDAIQEMEERKKNMRPLVWAKPTFCPFGGEIKTNDEGESSSEEGYDSSSSSSNKKQKESSSSDEQKPCSSSRSKVMDSCSNLLSKNSTTRKRNRHATLFPTNGLNGQSSVSILTDWTKEEVDRFLVFTNRVGLPERKRVKGGQQHVASSSALRGLSET